MTELENVISVLSAYKNHSFGDKAEKVTVEEIIALLKAREPKPPVIKENAYGWKFFYCPSCGREFYTSRKYEYVNGAKFCDKCGQAVKWE